jgi:hypothetical protein
MNRLQLRSRIVVLASALVLVALGIALGAGPLQHDATTRDRDLAAQKAKVRAADARIADLQGAHQLATAYAAATSGRVVAGTLAGRKVALVSLAGADDDTVDALAALVHSAGGEVTARVALTSALLAQSSSGLLDALTSQMITQTPGLALPAGASAYQRFAALLARGIGVPPSAHAASASYDATAISIVSGLEAAKVIEKAQVTARAGLTLVVLPGRTSASSDATAVSVLATYAGALPTVVAGPTASARADGLIARLRRTDAFPASTLDSIEEPVGRVSAILALAARTRGIAGAYGLIGEVDGAVPPVS